MLRFSLLFLFFCLYGVRGAPNEDTEALLAFKDSADRGRTLDLLWNEGVDHCEWEGVRECRDGRVTKLVLENYKLNGSVSENSISRLVQLRVLSLKGNGLTGNVPDLSNLRDLKILYLSHNRFAGAFPVSILRFHRLKVVVLADNLLSGEIPVSVSRIPRLRTLCLENNRFTGRVPRLNQRELRFFNVSFNNLSGEIPETRVMRSFNASSFLGNARLCGQIIHRNCNRSSAISTDRIHGGGGLSKGKIAGIVAASAAALILIVSVMICLVLYLRSRPEAAPKHEEGNVPAEPKSGNNSSSELQNNGNLVFLSGEVQSYSLEDLLRSTAEIMGRGTLGSTYKAVMEQPNGRVSLTVKRLNNATCAQMSRSTFENHMETLGRLRHPNVVPLRAYFHTKEERLLVYDYYRNGSLWSLIHGAGGKPLHWTSCVKIAEDVALGLDYLHSVGLLHGDLKSTNVVIGSDFEACVVDYSLNAGYVDEEEASGECPSGPYRPAESLLTRKMTQVCDVFGYGVMLLEVLTGRRAVTIREVIGRQGCDVAEWVRSMRAEDVGGDVESESTVSGSTSEECGVEMLTALAGRCVAESAEERMEMRDVVRWIRDSRQDKDTSSSPWNDSLSPTRWSSAIQSLPRGDHASDRSLTERD